MSQDNIVQKQHYQTTIKDSVIGLAWTFWLNNLVFLALIVLQAFGVTHLSTGIFITYTICTTLLLLISIISLSLHIGKDK